MATTPLVTSAPGAPSQGFWQDLWDGLNRQNVVGVYVPPTPPAPKPVNTGGGLLDLIKSSTLPELIDNAATGGLTKTQLNRIEVDTRGNTPLSPEEIAKRQNLVASPNAGGAEPSAFDDLFSALPNFPFIDSELVTDAENAALWGGAVLVLFVLVIVVAK